MIKEECLGFMLKANKSPLTPPTTTFFLRWSADISYKDDVTVILLLVFLSYVLVYRSFTRMLLVRSEGKLTTTSVPPPVHLNMWPKD